MRVYHLILFFVCLNASLFLISEVQMFPLSLAPIDTMASIETRLLGGFATFTLITLISGIGGYLVYGVTIGLLLWIADIFLGTNGIMNWILYGIPTFATQAAAMMGVEATALTAITIILRSIIAVVWFWFIVGFISQRGTTQL